MSKSIDNEVLKHETRANEKTLANRQRLLQLFENSPLPTDQLLVNLGLYMRSSALTKILYIHELYQLIRDVPGVIIEFGVWWGQNLALYENLRAIYEPFNAERRIIGFDTFEGYTELSDQDKRSAVITPGGHSVGVGYEAHLEEMLDYHERENVLYHQRKFSLIKGDVTRTFGEYLTEHPETIVSLAYFDMALYEPTKFCLEAIRPHLVPGSVLAMDELNSPMCPGETVAFREVFGSTGYEIRNSRIMPGRSLVIIK